MQRTAALSRPSELNMLCTVVIRHCAVEWCGVPAIGLLGPGFQQVDGINQVRHNPDNMLKKVMRLVLFA